jgi:hypothetical protein
MSSAPTHGKGYGVAGMSSFLPSFNPSSRADCLDTKNYQNFTVQEYKLKTECPHDVTIAIEFCGVCGSDVGRQLATRASLIL